ncbi:MAG: hypothetical protein QHH07_01705 [Sedimentisphaerales bacterium]|jgi:uncharacterized repeat protein (TIGR04138 family)|nr:hypothetical protein [Sedimentisphaerales bacterium]
MPKTPEQVGKEHGRYSPAAYRFVYEGLGYTLQKLGHTGHVTGQTLCHGLLALALDRWGKLALTVLNSWGIHTTRDFGQIVWALIQNQLMTAQPGDSIDDFNNAYDLKAAITAAFRF